ncbi:hypothetical protein ACVWZ6_001893 [Bradyrhizobium sp. GM6.1]
MATPSTAKIAASRQDSDQSSPRTSVATEDQDAGEREARGEQDQRRAMGHADLAGDEGVAPEQAEQADGQRQRVEAAARNGKRRGERHEGHSPEPSI